MVTCCYEAFSKALDHSMAKRSLNFAFDKILLQHPRFLSPRQTSKSRKAYIDLDVSHTAQHTIGIVTNSKDKDLSRIVSSGLSWPRSTYMNDWRNMWNPDRQIQTKQKKQRHEPKTKGKEFGAKELEKNQNAEEVSKFELDLYRRLIIFKIRLIRVLLCYKNGTNNSRIHSLRFSRWYLKIHIVNHNSKC